MNFSVLMSVYTKENPEYVDRAFRSICDEQSIKPQQIVLVEDGRLNEGLYSVIQKWKSILGDTLKSVPLAENMGLGTALKIGLENCDYEIVARMDTDDIASPDRFEKQLYFLEENPHISVVGSFITEFEGDEQNIYAKRVLPQEPERLSAFAKRRNPLNHMTVMFVKNDVLSVGNYIPFLGFEDYYLWIRMLNAGKQIAKLPMFLVNARAGAAMLGRRGGLGYAITEYKLQREFLRIGFIGILDFMSNVFVRFSTRITPHTVRTIFYKKLLRKS